MKGLRYLLVTFMINSLILSGSLEKTIFHENLGVMLIHQGVLESVQNSWHQTFVFDLSTPEITKFDDPCRTKEANGQPTSIRNETVGQSTIEAAPNTLHSEDETVSAVSQFCPAINAYRKRHDYLLDEINKAVMEIETILPEPVQVNRSRRGLFDFVGQIEKSLFGTGTVKDEAILAKHIGMISTNDNQITDRLNMLDDALESYLVKTSKQA